MELGLDKKDLVVIAALSIVYFILSNYNLGNNQIPVNPWEPPGSGMVVIQFQAPSSISSLFVLTGGERTVNFQIYDGYIGNWSYVASFQGSEYYRWGNADIDRTTQHIAFSFTGKSGKIIEIVLTGQDGEMLDLGETDIWLEGDEAYDVRPLIDEQDAVKFPPTRFSEAHFDEVYYVRTAEEYLKMREVYEWTHPPLGKLLVASGILLFGFNPYGWRIMGALISTLMIPVIYVLGKRMFKSRAAATFSASLLALDFMHFTMGRIATPETFAVFFNLASILFFYDNYRGLLDEGELKKTSIFLGSVFFTLGFSTKWYTIFGLMGQLFLLMLAFFKNRRCSEKGSPMKARRLFAQLVLTLIFSLLVSIGIYLSTFIPHLLMGHNLYDVYALQWQMFGYHSGLKAEHPFSSAWWSWPLSIRPLWLTVDNIREGWVSTVVAMGNPLIWWMGAVFAIIIADRAVRNRDETGIFLTATLLFQWLPFASMSRCLFIYHFFINVPIVIFVSTYFLNEYWRNPSGRIYVVAYMIATAIVFALFYPVISGYPIPDQYRLLLRWLPSWVF